MEFLDVKIPPNPSINPQGLYPWMRVLAGAPSVFLQLNMAPGTGPSGNHTGGHLYDYTGAEILAGGGGGGGAPVDATYILQTPNGLLPNAQALSTITAPYSVLGLGATPTTGVVSELTQIIDNASSLYIGKNSSNLTATGTGNLTIGPGAGNGLISGNSNTFVGANTGIGITTGNGNMCLGNGANITNPSSNSCIAIGENAQVTAIPATGNACANISNNVGASGNLLFGINNSAPIVTLDISNTISGTSAIQLASTGAALAINPASTSAIMFANNGLMYTKQGTTNAIYPWVINLGDIHNVDVTTATPVNGQVLTYSSTSSKWINENATGGTGTANALATTGTAVTVSTAAPPTTGQALVATSATTAAWQTVGGGSGAPFVSNSANPILEDFTDHTKLLAFNLSALTTGTTDTLIVPANTGDTLVLLNTAQTLTNKTLDSTTNTVRATSLATSTTPVVVSAATAPTSGQVLTATSGTAATWQTPSSTTVINSAMKADSSASQVVPANTPTVVNFPSSAYDVHSDYNTSTSTFTTPADAIYTVSASVVISNGSSTDCTLAIQSTGTGLISYARLNPNAISNSNTNTTVVNISGNIRTTVGDAITVTCTSIGNSVTLLTGSLLEISLVRNS